ncbi:hypothetical protein J6590_102295 [Homalodisca vitripennis]|nr:hypothetical protein J6590_102295 [Homalodisca vitripennis]
MECIYLQKRIGNHVSQSAWRIKINMCSKLDVAVCDKNHKERFFELVKNKNSSITREHGEYKKQTGGRTERAEDHPIEERVYREKMTIAASGPGLGTMQLNTSANRNYER